MLLLTVAAAAYDVGRALALHAIDSAVYHRAAQSLLAGRSDLGSATLALKPPMRHVYPPLFVLLVVPLGLLALEDAFGLWFALLVMATVRAVSAAAHLWRPRDVWTYGTTAAMP